MAKPVTIRLFGYKSPISCYEQVRNEFTNLGCQIIEHGSADIGLHLNGFFNDILDWKEKESPNAVTIGILLDAAPQNKDWPEKMVYQQLWDLDIPCTISKTSKSQIEKRLNKFGVIPNINVVYYPAKNVEFLNYIQTLEFSTIGRVSGNKRFHLIGETLDVMGVNRNLLAVVGPERPPFGVWAGLIPETELSGFYNSSKFVFNLCGADGLGLNSVETVLVKNFPVVTRDNDVMLELGLGEFAADPDPQSLALKINHINCNQKYYKDILETLQPKFKELFSVTSICDHILSLYKDFQEKKLAS